MTPERAARRSEDDQEARALWGAAFNAIPKSAFALAAWYLADCASDEGVGQGGEVRRFREELDALRGSGILSEGATHKAMHALERLQLQIERDER